MSQEEGRKKTEEEEAAVKAGRCPECGGRIIEYEERGELVCSECGLVVEEKRMEEGPEWRAYTQEEREARARTGAPETVLLHEKGLTTDIGRGRDLSPEKRRQFLRLRQRHKETRMRTSQERSLSTGLQELRRMSSTMGLSTVALELAASLFKQAVDKDLLPGRSIEAMSAACLYLGSRLSQSPRTLDEISEAATVPRTEIGRAERYIRSELEVNVPPVSPKSFLPRLTSDLELGTDVEIEAGKLIDGAAKQGIVSGRDPMSIAAAAIYLAAKQLEKSVTQSAVADVSRVSEVTIRNRYKELQSMEE